jgi:hypothetical protein
LGLEETNEGVQPRKRTEYEGMYVKPGDYSKIVDDFLDSGMGEAKVTLDKDELLNEKDSIPADTLYKGLWNNINKARDVEGVSVVKRGDEVYLVKT